MSNPIEEFQQLLQDAIEFRERVLFPSNPLFELPFDLKGVEILQKEQELLKSALDQFKLIVARSDESQYAKECMNTHYDTERWNSVYRSKCLLWRDIDGRLEIKYRDKKIYPSWELMKELSQMDPQDMSAEIHRILEQDKKKSSNNFSAYNIFANCLKDGEIRIPDRFSPVREVVPCLV